MPAPRGPRTPKPPAPNRRSTEEEIVEARNAYERRHHRAVEVDGTAAVMMAAVPAARMWLADRLEIAQRQLRRKRSIAPWPALPQWVTKHLQILEGLRDQSAAIEWQSVDELLAWARMDPPFAVLLEELTLADRVRRALNEVSPLPDDLSVRVRRLAGDNVDGGDARHHEAMGHIAHAVAVTRSIGAYCGLRRSLSGETGRPRDFVAESFVDALFVSCAHIERPEPTVQDAADIWLAITSDGRSRKAVAARLKHYVAESHDRRVRAGE